MSQHGRSRDLRRRAAGDEGIGLITVIGLASASASVVALSGTVAINSLASSRGHEYFESSLAAAETGLDGILGDVQTAYDNGVVYNPADYGTVPMECTPPSWPAEWTSSGLPTPAEEKAWLLTQVNALPESCLTAAGRGEYYAFRAKSAAGNSIPVVYAIGWTPDRDSDSRGARVLRAEYLFSPFKPNQAILTEANLVFSGSVEVDLAEGSTSTTADVHSNGSVTAGNNSLTINGNMTASGANDRAGSCPDGKILGYCKAEEPPQAIPKVSARSIYRALAHEASASWFDLCPDGTVKAPNTTTVTPCSGEVLSASGAFRGWELVDAGDIEATWVFTPVDGTDYPGAYYAYQTNVSLEKGKGNKNDATMSVMAEAKPNGWPSHSATCDKSGGSITWKHSNIANYLPGVIFVADTFIIGDSNSDVRSGVIAAGDYIDWNTSSSTIRGSMVSSGNCPTSPTNIIQGVTLSYDSSSEVPLSTLIRTTQWLELVG